MNIRGFLEEHIGLTRRSVLKLGAAGMGVASLDTLVAQTDSPPPQLQQALAKVESYLTPPDQFGDVSRGRPVPHTLPEAQLQQAGLTRDTWRLEVISDPENPATLHRQLTVADGSALDFNRLMKLAETRVVRFAKVMTCLNIGCPLGMGIWEGVPLRDVIWLTEPQENVRRIFYYGYHNDDPKQMFLSSLPLARVLEDPYDLPPVILCYKLNGQWLDIRRGGPVRVVVPEAYGFKSIKWLSHVVLTNLPHANDSYASGNNDLDSPLKSFAATLLVPNETSSGKSIVVTGYAQVGISGLSKVQYWVTPAATQWPADDEYFATAPWLEAELLSPPNVWGGNLPDDRIPPGTIGFDAGGRPQSWPMRLTKVHWVAVLPPLPRGQYQFRCRTVDEKGIGQPLPRPHRKSGHAAIETVPIRVV